MAKDRQQQPSSDGTANHKQWQWQNGQQTTDNSQAVTGQQSMNLCKKESQLQSKKTDFSQEKSRKSQLFWLFFDFSLTFLDWNLFFLTITDFLFYRAWTVTMTNVRAGEAWTWGLSRDGCTNCLQNEPITCKGRGSPSQCHDKTNWEGKKCILHLIYARSLTYSAREVKQSDDRNGKWNTKSWSLGSHSECYPHNIFPKVKGHVPGFDDNDHLRWTISTKCCCVADAILNLFLWPQLSDTLWVSIYAFVQCLSL